MERKTILITGCSSGIGYSTASYLRKKGYRVFATCRKAKDVSRLKKDGFESFLLDVSSSQSIKKAVSEVKKRANILYALFNNAGVVIPGAVEDLTRHSIRVQFETNVFGAIELTNLLMPIFRKQKHGRIIFNSSVLGFISLPFKSAYCASKYALEAFVDGLRLESPRGISISLIEPGPIKTKIEANALLNFEKFVSRKNCNYSSEYGQLIREMSKNQALTPFRIPPSSVAKQIYKILEVSNPKSRYYITIPTYFVRYFKPFIPSRILDLMLSKSK
jgi:NAD(P)-dependent dehydrogenase (short-subunit alcohol dehydrogenase family)